VVAGSKPFLILWRQQPKAKRAEAVLGFSGVVVVYGAARRSTGRWSRTEDGSVRVKMQLGLRMLRCVRVRKCKCKTKCWRALRVRLLVGRRGVWAAGNWSQS
jgi:hypothetical protein